MTDLEKKILEKYEGKVVRKDLTKLLKTNAVVPSYVLEYLLGQHCSTNDQEIIDKGIEKVKSIISNHFVHRDQAEVIKSNIRERGNYRIIDKLAVSLNDRENRYEARFSNLALKGIPISDDIVTSFQRLLSEGVWALVNMAYVPIEERNSLPWVIESVKPIQISSVDEDEYIEARKSFDLSEWVDFLMQSIGLNPDEFSDRSKLIQLSRLIPFAENNYNLIELGPKGTGKSHIYSEMSPHGILISGAEVSKAKLFVNNATGKIGLVGYWDVVAYDEFAGVNKRVDKGLVDIMKNYMANKTFSRGTDVNQAEASMVFVGNTDRSVQNMIKHNDLFIALPKGYRDSAFLDRLHIYLPGWEVPRLKNDSFTDRFGFIVDYLAEILKRFRKKDFSKAYKKYFDLSDLIAARDRIAIEKTFSGLTKILFPSGDFSESEAEMMMIFAIEGRRRVQAQLVRMDETFKEVEFSYFNKDSEVTKKITTLEEKQFLKGEPLPVMDKGSDMEAKGGIAKRKIPTKSKPQLKGKHVEITDNQLGVSYENLFGDYFEKAKEITIEDPYIRYPYQFRNLTELVNTIAGHRDGDDPIRIKVITSNEEEYIEECTERFEILSESLLQVNIFLGFEFKELNTLHDRYILVDDQWKIILGRGLDIWQKTDGYFDIAGVNPLLRRCKGFLLTVLKKDNF